MIKIISLVFQLAFVAGGVALGLQMKSSAPTGEHEEGDKSEKDHGKDGDHKKPDKKKDKKKEKDSHGKKSKGGHGDEKGDDSGYGYLKFSRQFIVPIVAANNVDTLLIIDINLEITPSATEDAYSQEPKLRDALLTTLLKLSNEGFFNDDILKEGNIEEIRAALLEAAQAIIGDDALEVLILNIARQDL